jgi:hypothetical protein
MAARPRVVGGLKTLSKLNSFFDTFDPLHCTLPRTPLGPLTFDSPWPPAAPVVPSLRGPSRRMIENLFDVRETLEICFPTGTTRCIPSVVNSFLKTLCLLGNSAYWENFSWSLEIRGGVQGTIKARKIHLTTDNY